jgi:transporter family protein
MDYRIYCAISLVGWGLWAYFSKLLTRSLSPTILIFFTSIGSMLAVTFYTLLKTKLVINTSIFWAMLVGVLSAVATVSFYQALAKGPTSVVVPWTGLYFIVPAILGFVFLKETITVNHIIGILAAIVAIVFLSK